MSKKLVAIIMTLALTVSTNCNIFAAPSASDSELKQAQDAKKDLQVKVQQLDKEIDEVLKKVEANKKEMNTVAKEIKSTQSKLEVVESQSKEHDELFKKRVRAMYINGNDGYLGVILASNDMGDFLSRMETISKVMEFDKNVIDKLKKEKETITNQKKSLDAENNKLLALKQSNESTLAKLNKDVKEQKDLLNKATEKEKSIIASAEASKNASYKGATLSRGMSTGSYSKAMTMEATAYCGDGVTASGTATKRNPGGYSTIAVDPRVIPIGTRVYVDGYGYAVAEDTGGAIKGNIIDLFMTSEGECQSWGRRNVTVYILN